MRHGRARARACCRAAVLLYNWSYSTLLLFSYCTGATAITAAIYRIPNTEHMAYRLVRTLVYKRGVARPLTTRHELLTTHHLLLTTFHSLLSTFYSRLITHHSLFTAHNSTYTRPTSSPSLCRTPPSPPRGQPTLTSSSRPPSRQVPHACTPYSPAKLPSHCTLAGEAPRTLAPTAPQKPPTTP